MFASGFGLTMSEGYGPKKSVMVSITPHGPDSKKTNDFGSLVNSSPLILCSPLTITTTWKPPLGGKLMKNLKRAFSAPSEGNVFLVCSFAWN